MLIKCIGAVLVFFSLVAQAYASRPNYNYLGLGYTRQLLDYGCNQDGLFLEGSLALNEIAYVHAHHEDLESNRWCGWTSTSLGFGVRSSIGRQSSVYGQAALIHRDYGNNSEVGMALGAGVRGFVAPGTEIRGFLTHESVDKEQDTIWGVGLNYWLTRFLSVNTELSTSKDSHEAITFGLRLNFY